MPPEVRQASQASFMALPKARRLPISNCWMQTRCGSPRCALFSQVCLAHERCLEGETERREEPCCRAGEVSLTGPSPARSQTHYGETAHGCGHHVSGGRDVVRFGLHWAQPG